MMNFEIFHQLGHLPRWNFESFQDDGIGDGFILSPSHMDYSTVISLPESIRKISIFDPQFFKPNFQKGKLSTYPFFPDQISEGFITTEFGKETCEKCAELCIDFQIQNNFAKIIIPTRYVQRTPINYFQEQSELFVEPFLNVIEKLNVKVPLLLQLVVNESMLNDEEFSSEMLNWITRYSSLSGVYLIADIFPRQKQITNVDFLRSYINFCKALRENDFYVLLGYLNNESVLLSLANPSAMTIGTYDNKRIFNIKNFEYQDKSKRNPPYPRIYVSKLLHSINHTYKNAIITKLGVDFFDKNKYQVTMFTPSFQWHFQKPELYKHYFYTFGKQLKELSILNPGKRYDHIFSLLNKAEETFTIINESNIFLDDESKGYFINPWKTVANFYKT